MRATRPRSSTASLVIIACELPTATASASTPVAAVNLAASAGSVRAPGACTPSLPPISPSSASTHTSRSWHQAATRAVAATLPAYGSTDASNIAEPKPSPTASVTRSSLVA